MKKYSELTDNEKETLTEEDIEMFVKRELMELGETPEPSVPKPEYPSNVKLTTYYQIGQLLFRTPKEAEKLIALKPLSNTYNYAIGYNIRMAIEKQNDEMKIEMIQLPSYEEAMSHGEELTQYNTEYERWREINDTNRRYAETRQNVIKKIWGDFNEVQRRKTDRDLISRTYEEYKKLAISDNAAYMFLIKTFGEERVKNTKIERPAKETEA